MIQGTFQSKGARTDVRKLLLCRLKAFAATLKDTHQPCWVYALTQTRIARDLDGSSGTSILSPKYLTPSGAYEICCWCSVSIEWIFNHVDACRPRAAHFKIFTFIPDQCNHFSAMSSRCWQAFGDLATRLVSLAYCSRLTDLWDEENSYPRSCLVRRVSTMVLITVLKMTTDNGSPQWTLSWMGIASVAHEPGLNFVYKPV